MSTDYDTIVDEQQAPTPLVAIYKVSYAQQRGLQNVLTIVKAQIASFDATFRSLGIEATFAIADDKTLDTATNFEVYVSTLVNVASLRKMLVAKYIKTGEAVQFIDQTWSDEDFDDDEESEEDDNA